ncbi:F-box/FBD/LRR-repeat protein At5g53840 [Linum perenne]
MNNIFSGAGAGHGKEDKISSLSDDIIHEILARLDHTKEAARIIVLSKRWPHIWSSYPILEFNDHDFLRNSDSAMKAAVEKYESAAVKKFSHRPIKAVRIFVLDSRKQFITNFVDNIFNLAAKNCPHEIDFRVQCSPNGYRIPQYTNSGDRFRRLQVLKLQNCYFSDDHIFDGISSLKILDLSYAEFDNCRTLNRMIADCPLLETLTLFYIEGIQKVQIQNHPNLKSFDATHFDNDNHYDFEITGARSLEILRIKRDIKEGNLRISSIPNLKQLHLEGVQTLTDNVLNKLISELPCLESLTLIDLPSGVEQLRIVHSDQLQRVELYADRRPLPRVLEIDAPKLTNLFYTGNYNRFSKIFEVNKSRSSSVSFDCRVLEQLNHRQLKELVDRFSQFRLSLKLCQPVLNQMWDRMEDKIYTPVVIERLTFARSNTKNCNDEDDNLDHIFSICHPKFLTLEMKLVHDQDEDKFRSGVKNICKELIKKRDSKNRCSIACKCSGHRLKDVKMIQKEVVDGEVEVSVDVVSSVIKREDVVFILTWH